MKRKWQSWTEGARRFVGKALKLPGRIASRVVRFCYNHPYGLALVFAGAAIISVPAIP
jgi:hypothetical protein